MSPTNEQELRDRLFELWRDGRSDNDRYNSVHAAEEWLLDWHNKQVEEVLDRIESKGLNEDGGSRYVNTPDGYVAATAWNEAQDRVEQAIEAERAKLKEVK